MNNGYLGWTSGAFSPKRLVAVLTHGAVHTALHDRVTPVDRGSAATGADRVHDRVDPVLQRPSQSHSVTSSSAIARMTVGPRRRLSISSSRSRRSAAGLRGSARSCATGSTNSTGRGSGTPARVALIAAAKQHRGVETPSLCGGFS